MEISIEVNESHLKIIVDYCSQALHDLYNVHVC